MDHADLTDREVRTQDKRIAACILQFVPTLVVGIIRKQEGAKDVLTYMQVKRKRWRFW